MGNLCCPLKKFKYTFISINKKQIKTSNESTMLFCKICHQLIIDYSVIVTCNDCKKIIGHADCVDTDKICILCIKS